MKRILDNIKHLPTTIAGGAVLVSAAVQHPLVQQFAQLNPKLANSVTALGAIAGGLVLMFGANTAKFAK